MDMDFSEIILKKENELNERILSGETQNYERNFR